MLRALTLICLATPAFATSQEEVLSARLLPGWQTPDGTHMAALELTLAPGWKTYWRTPGDLGLAPVFDWAGSRNVSGAAFHWPAPKVVEDEGMVTLAFYDRLILPVEIRPEGPGPVEVRLRMDLGICKEICMPAELHFDAVLQGEGAPDATITAALEQMPRRQSPDIACAVEPIEDGLRLTTRIAMTGTDPFVVMETADPRIWVSRAETRVEGGALVSTADLVPPEGAPFALDRSGVTVTVLGAGHPVEIRGCPAG